jgi:hypothetical protein
MAANSNFFDYLRNHFGDNTVVNFKEYITTREKIENATGKKEFFLKCRSYGIIPNHINNNMKCTYQLISPQ